MSMGVVLLLASFVLSLGGLFIFIASMTRNGRGGTQGHSIASTPFASGDEITKAGAQ
jgi:hypothetical protein